MVLYYCIFCKTDHNDENRNGKKANLGNKTFWSQYVQYCEEENRVPSKDDTFCYNWTRKIETKVRNYQKKNYQLVSSATKKAVEQSLQTSTINGRRLRPRKNEIQAECQNVERAKQDKRSKAVLRRCQSKRLGTNDTVVNTGLGKVKLESDLKIPNNNIKLEGFEPSTSAFSSSSCYQSLESHPGPGQNLQSQDSDLKFVISDIRSKRQEVINQTEEESLELVVKKRTVNGKVEYSTKWKNPQVSDSDVSEIWQPKESLQFPELIKDFENELEIRKNRNNLNENNNNNKHPLLNKRILTNLTKFIPINEYKTFRLVSKTWLSVLNEKWYSSTTLKLTRSVTDENKIMINEEISLDEFLKLWNENSEIRKPFQNLYLKYWKFNIDKYSNKTFQENFWRLLGQNLTTLSLDLCHFHSSNDLFHVIYEFCPVLKKLILFSSSVISYGIWTDSQMESCKTLANKVHQSLETIIIVPTSSSEGSNTQFLKIKWLKLLKKFPSVSTLYIGNDNDDDGEDESKLSNKLILSKPENDDDDNSIVPSSFKISTGFPIKFGKENLSISTLFGYIPIRFQEIKLSFGAKNGKRKIMTESELKSLLTIHREIITSLTIQINGLTNIFGYSWDFPFGTKLNNLTKLGLNSDKICKSLEFLKDMRNLKQLQIGELNNERYNFSTWIVSKIPKNGMINVKLENLSKLKLFNRFSCEELQKLTKWMPNITVLEMCLDDKQFVIVCSNWKGLRKLTVNGNCLGDDGVTGQRYFRFGTGVGLDMIYEDEEEDEDDIAQPNITFLKELEIFKCPANTRITNDSVFEGFLKMKKLRKVILPKSRITLKGLIAMKNKNIYVEVHPNAKIIG